VTFGAVIETVGKVIDATGVAVIVGKVSQSSLASC
jgi:hypothetical protein